MHQIQKKILLLVANQPLSNISIRQIGLLVDVEHPQAIKHHLEQLEIKGLVKYDRDSKTLSSLQNAVSENDLLTLPIYGSANCGPAMKFADNYIEGYLRISKSLLKKTADVIILEASGDSMNMAKVNGKQNIEDGDYVVIDTKQKNPESGEYIVSVIDGMANIKKFILDKDNHQIVLMPESTKNYSPIFIGEDELESYSICGKVVQVIKKPKY